MPSPARAIRRSSFQDLPRRVHAIEPLGEFAKPVILTALFQHDKKNQARYLKRLVLRPSHHHDTTRKIETCDPAPHRSIAENLSDYLSDFAIQQLFHHSTQKEYFDSDLTRPTIEDLHEMTPEQNAQATMGH